MKKCCKKFISLLMISTLIASFSFEANANIIYSPGTVKGGALTPLTDPALNPMPNANAGIVTPTAAASISQIVIQNNFAQPVSIPQGSLINSAPGNMAGTTINTTNATILTTGFNIKNITGTDALKKTINAPAYVLVNATTNSLYVGKDYDGKYDPAGLANLMTAYIATTFFEMDDVLKVKSSAVRGVDKDASIAALNDGDTITLKDAIASMFIKGCVDSANVIAENVSGNIADFVTLMNKTAKVLGLQNTTFTNPSGINDDQQLASCHDLAIVMGKVCENDELVKLMSLSEYVLPAAKRREKLVLYSKNSQLGKANSSYNPDLACSRLGYNSKANYCVASMTNYKGNHIIAIILSAKGSQFSDTKKLLDFGKVACEEDSR